MNKAALTAGLTLALAACVTSRPPPRATDRPRPVAAIAAATTSFVAGATAMLGQPYRWGGAAPGGFDCSGLVFYAAAGAGIRLPRTAAQQLQMGRSVPRGELRAGDLVFMHLTHKKLHVGIALDADRFVNAPAAGGQVRIDSLNAAPYARGFLQARRLVDEPASAGGARGRGAVE